LSSDQIERLSAFTEREDLLVVGLDRSDKRPYRAGCLPYVGLVAAGVFGFAALPVDLNVLPGGAVIASGEHWYFQLWFRDNFTAPTSNTTNGVTVMFR
jgi:hypothetical protein